MERGRVVVLEQQDMDIAGSLICDTVEYGVVILTGCKADQLIFKRDDLNGTRKRCSGVTAVVSNENFNWHLCIKAKASISACGPLLIPPLLISSGLKISHIGRNLHPFLLAWGYFLENSATASINGRNYEGGIITVIHKVIGEDADRVQIMVETLAHGPASFASLFHWTSRADMKKTMVKYPRMAHLSALVQHGTVGVNPIITIQSTAYCISEKIAESLRKEKFPVDD
ncbi:hypothetical protein MLD38_031692 [Melastoma candidum]|uniref:Uncharacterized protein n=1 Tax=Melastoma candidum TaxID=119954 RepID=A0ACB9MR25_9MYRT|nr:hypothetical protein MLD38_031692 [Melastoma candidum]